MSFIRSNIPSGNLYEANFSGRPASTWGTLVTADSTSHTLGTKAEMIASTSFNAQMILVTIHATSAAATLTDALANIYIGPNGSETVLIPNLLAGWSVTFGQGVFPKTYAFPLKIPSGSRLSADLQALQTTPKTARIMIELFGGLNIWAGTGVETLGVSAASSQGTSTTPGGASEGTFVSIGTTTKVYRYVTAMIQGNIADTTISGGGIQALDVGTGGSPITGLENLLYVTNANEWVGTYLTNLGRYVTVDSGVSLQARLQCDVGELDPKDVAIYGVYA